MSGPQNLQSGPPQNLRSLPQVGQQSRPYLAGTRSAVRFFSFSFSSKLDFDESGKLKVQILQEGMRKNNVSSAINPDGIIEKNITSIAEELFRENNIGTNKGKSFENFSATIDVHLYE